MCRLDKLHRLRARIYRIAQKHKAHKVYVFGSCARKEDTPDSDVDLLAEFSSDASLFDHSGLEYDLTQILGCKVDVVALSALKTDGFAENVRKDMVAL